MIVACVSIRYELANEAIVCKMWVHKVNVDISVRSTNFATVFVHRAANVIYHLGSLNIISGILAGSTTNRTGTEQGTQTLITRSEHLQTFILPFIPLSSTNITLGTLYS